MRQPLCVLLHRPDAVRRPFQPAGQGRRLAAVVHHGQLCDADQRVRPGICPHFEAARQPAVYLGARHGAGGARTHDAQPACRPAHGTVAGAGGGGAALSRTGRLLPGDERRRSARPDACRPVRTVSRGAIRGAGAGRAHAVSRRARANPSVYGGGGARYGRSHIGVSDARTRGKRHGVCVPVGRVVPAGRRAAAAV